MDRAVSAFVNDVHERGLSDNILLVVTGEFGRTPRVNKNAGRDHWAPLSTLALAGGGLRMGQVVGESASSWTFQNDPDSSPRPNGDRIPCSGDQPKTTVPQSGGTTGQYDQKWKADRGIGKLSVQFSVFSFQFAGGNSLLLHFSLLLLLAHCRSRPDGGRHAERRVSVTIVGKSGGLGRPNGPDVHPARVEGPGSATRKVY